MPKGLEKEIQPKKDATQENDKQPNIVKDAYEASASGLKSQQQQLSTENNRKHETTKQFLPSIEITDAASTTAPATDALRSVDFKRLYEKNKDRIDNDHDGFLSKTEIDTAMTSNSFKGQDAQFLDVLKTHTDKIQKLNNDEYGFENDGVTSKDVDAFNDLANKTNRTQEEKDLIGGVDGRFWASGNQLKSASHDLYSDQQNPLNSITYDALKQGNIGDCYFISALSSLAKNNPQAVKDMIKDNGNGTYTVTFPGDPTHPVTVDAPTDSELGLYASGTKGNWPTVIEKAYGKYYDKDAIVSQDAVPDGSLLHDGVKLLSPGGADTDLVSFTSSSEIDTKLQQAIKDGQPITVSIRGNLMSVFNSSDDKTEQGLQTKHEYSVEGYDPASKTITIRNPWGRGEPLNADGKPRDGKDDGVFTMSLDEFEQTFSQLAYGQKTK